MHARLDPMTAPRPVPTRELPPRTIRPPSPALGLLLAYLAFVIGGSLVPFHFVPIPASQAALRFQSVWSDPLVILSRSDCLANLLLFVPLSFLAVHLLNRTMNHARTACVFVLLACPLLAVSLEFLQLFFPPRVVSLSDVLAESLGAFAGLILWLLLHRPLERSHALFALHRRLGRFLRPPLAVLLLVVLYIHLLPFDLTLSPVEIYHKYRDGLVRPLPELRYWREIQQQWTDILLFAAVGALAAIQSRGHPPRFRAVLLSGTAFALFLETLQLFVTPRTSALDDVILGGASVALGWTIVAHFPAVLIQGTIGSIRRVTLDQRR